MPKQTIHIVGSGMAGLLAANMLRSSRVTVLYEKANSLPNNHSAVLRFRSPIVGDTLGTPFRKVTMLKDVLRWKNPIADALAYSRKCTGVMTSDRSIIEGLASGDRWIAPSDLIPRMAESAGVVNFDYDFPFAVRDGKDPIVSTIPMPSLMEALAYPYRKEVSFVATNGINIRAKVANCDAFVSMYVPAPHINYSRVSITGDELIIELPNQIDTEFYRSAAFEIAKHAASLMGFGDVEVSDIRISRQRYSKILPIDDMVRRDFLHWATDKYNIFSLGRFATWRPKLLLDDLVHDIRLIEKWTEPGNRYSLRGHR